MTKHARLRAHKRITSYNMQEQFRRGGAHTITIFSKAPIRHYLNHEPHPNGRTETLKAGQPAACGANTGARGPVQAGPTERRHAGWHWA